MILPRRNGNIRAQPPSNLPISPVTAANQATAPPAAPAISRTPSGGPRGRRGSFLSRQNAIQTSSGSLSHQSECSSHSPSPSPVCTPLPFSESSRTYRGSVPNIPSASSASMAPSTRISRPQRTQPTASHSQPSLNGSRSRSSSRSPLGGASSESDRSMHDTLIPRISPPPQSESRRSGSRAGSRSGSTSPNQLQLPLQTLGGARKTLDRPRGGGYANTMLCPPTDGAPPPPYKECASSEEQDRITEDLAQVTLCFRLKEGRWVWQ